MYENSISRKENYKKMLLSYTVSRTRYVYNDQIEFPVPDSEFLRLNSRCDRYDLQYIYVKRYDCIRYFFSIKYIILISIRYFLVTDE